LIQLALFCFAFGVPAFPGAAGFGLLEVGYHLALSIDVPGGDFTVGFALYCVGFGFLLAALVPAGGNTVDLAIDCGEFGTPFATGIPGFDLAVAFAVDKIHFGDLGAVEVPGGHLAVAFAMDKTDCILPLAIVVATPGKPVVLAFDFGRCAFDALFGRWAFSLFGKLEFLAFGGFFLGLRFAVHQEKSAGE